MTRSTYASAIPDTLARPSRKLRKWGTIPVPPDHKPGQWPPGISLSDPAPERQRDAVDWTDAVRRYHTEQSWNLTEEEAP
ncbi:hypothetical protein [Streptomyces acidiscabies]|uniref:Uncharacterized protein n=1 Tax=Streptomyces acidiscabies TaxID=42234 RepID=A0ABU4LWF2_9ACTN|nr:hypothetical protein [Streptomyces acidiscabies]MDX3020038.1 hypothetical protein [Streptomyces acidiscabies]